MIYGYQYYQHKIETFHEGIMYFFEYLLKNEPSTFNRIDMFHPDFEPLMKLSKTKFDPLLEELVLEYAKLNAFQKKKVKLAFKNNNEIERLCNGYLTPIQYDDFKSTFSEKLKKFSKKLWEEYAHNNKVRKECGEVKHHFDKFTDPKHQKAFLCPFCGLNSLKPSSGEYRDAYDHYLPMSLYPFISMNFKNLAPTCHDCNSNEKGDNPVIFKNSIRRKVFFPFDFTLKSEDLQLKIVPTMKYNKSSKSTLLSKINFEYEIKIGRKYTQQIKSWEDIYGIKKRYKEYIPSMQSEWFSWIVDRYKESVEDKVSFSKFKQRRLKELRKQINSREKGLMQYSYIEYFLSQSNIEKKLKSLIKK